MKTTTRKLLFNIATSIAVACTAALVLVPSIASAAPAQATGSVNVRSAPSATARVVDRLVFGEIVDVKGCRSGWCYITHPGPDGYVSARYLTRNGIRMEPNFNLSFNFGNGSISIGTGGFGIGQPPIEFAGEVCFYEHVNYSGRAFCVEQSSSAAQLGGNWNDRISSIYNPDGLRVTVCTDWGFDGDCRIYRSSARNLGDFNDEISSIRVR